MVIVNQIEMADIIAEGISKRYPKFKGKEIDIKFGQDNNGRFYTKVKLADEKE